MRRLSLSQARRIHLGAQGFADPRPAGRVDVRHLRRVLRRTGLLQIDSVNVVARAHYMPVFSRIGPYPPELLDDLTYRRRELFEYWVHEASIVPVQLHPLLRHRMAGSGAGRRARALMADLPGYIEAVAEEVAAHGPLRVSELSDPGSSSGPWWGWSKGKTALEHLFSVGTVAVADRDNFVRRYDLTERVLPAEVLAAPTPTADDGRRALLLRAARHLGVATAAGLADYHRQSLRRAGPLIDALVGDGELQPVRVQGRAAVCYLDPAAPVPRAIPAATVLSPFDPVVFHRPRAEWLFDFSYRIEIYVPASRRRYGYYVLPFLHTETIAGRADVRADRRRGRLVVNGAWWEHGARAPTDVWVRSLQELAAWLGLDDIEIADRGDAASGLRRSLS